MKNGPQRFLRLFDLLQGEELVHPDRAEQRAVVATSRRAAGGTARRSCCGRLRRGRRHRRNLLAPNRPHEAASSLRLRHLGEVDIVDAPLVRQRNGALRRNFVRRLERRRITRGVVLPPAAIPPLPATLEIQNRAATNNPGNRPKASST